MTDEVFDLDAARTAAADASRQPFLFTFGGRQYTISRPLPLAVVFAVSEGRWKGIVQGLFGEQTQDILDAGLTQDDVSLLFEQLMGGPGKSSKSPGSSRTSGRKSKPTSPSTTD